MKYTPPVIGSEGFNCPFCSAYAHMNWRWLAGYSQLSYTEAECAKCKGRSLWKVNAYETNPNHHIVPTSGDMLFPDHGFAPPPHDEMPEEIRDDYLEAAAIVHRSPRGAAALLRLCLQKLCKHLKQPGKNINTDIRQLAEDGTLPPSIIKAADIVRITGNCAVHPGQMVDNDLDFVATKLFRLINTIVTKAISEPKEMEELYNMTPEQARKEAEAKDRINKEKQAKRLADSENQQDE
ncbi:DUF4145 domain-containing protein [Pseudomonas canadensis]|uniref:DUF4145 domain-containing protein n=1 Tax=Pseudomonas canadensis TaxID=915099 RepID=UPI0027373DD2|nr:DUF4145 domain-containing protein [Pseudomonas canadensis]WLH32672.1 DUF4145 domain-containing protein [Pseudomonas canadensis]